MNRLAGRMHNHDENSLVDDADFHFRVSHNHIKIGHGVRQMVTWNRRIQYCGPMPAALKRLSFFLVQVL